MPSASDVGAAASNHTHAVTSLTGTANSIVGLNGSGVGAARPVSADVLSVIDAANNAAILAILGLGDLATQDTINPATQLVAAVPVSMGGTGATTASDARTNLGLGNLATFDQGAGLVESGGNINVDTSVMASRAYAESLVAGVTVGIESISDASTFGKNWLSLTDDAAGRSALSLGAFATQGPTVYNLYGAIADRPAAGSGNLGIIYYATDEGRAYECRRTGDLTYAWHLKASGADAETIRRMVLQETLSVSSASAGNGSASGTATSITLGLPSGQSATARSSEPATILASTGVITGVEAIAHIASLTSSTGSGLAVGIGDSGSGDAGAGCVLSVRIASDAAWDASVGASPVASNYNPGGGGTFGAAGQDGNSWVRFVISRDARYAIYAGRGASLAAAAWTRLASGDLTTVLTRNARNNFRAAIYSGGAVGTTISASVDAITWTSI